MLLYIPAIYFSIILLHICRRQGFSIAACIIGLYAIMAILAIPLYTSGYIQGKFYPIEFSPLATLIYCLMPTLLAWPFYQFNSNEKRTITCTNTKWLDILSWTSIGVFIFLAIFLASDIEHVLSMGDAMGALRGDEDYAAETAIGSSTGPLRVVGIICNILSSVSSVALILFFYNICFRDTSKILNTLLFLSSTSGVLVGIVGVDRSSIFFWIIRFVFIYCLFRPYFTGKTKRVVFVAFSVLIGLLIAYLTVLTMSRFEENSQQSLLFYFGQSYLMFSTFWNTVQLPETNWGIFHPIITQFFGSEGSMPVSTVEYGKELAMRVGFFINVFYSFMGSIVIYIGQEYVIPYCILYWILTKVFVKTNEQINVYDLLILFVMAQVSLCGVIVYIFTEYAYALGYLLVFVGSYIASRFETGK